MREPPIAADERASAAAKLEGGNVRVHAEGQERRLKVAIIVPSLRRQGPVIAMRSLADGLLENGHEVTVFYFDRDGSGPPTPLARRIQGYRPIPFKHFDVVHSCGIRPDAYVAFWARFYRFTSVTTMQNYMYDDLAMLYGKWIARLATFVWSKAVLAHLKVVALSGHMANYYRAQLRFADVVAIPNGLNFDKRNNAREPAAIYGDLRSRGLFIIGSVGVMIRRKGFEILVEILRKHPDCAVVLIGDGPERPRLERAAVASGVRDRLYMLGYVEGISDHFVNWDVYASTAYSEGFSLAMMEAMSVGLPILATKLPMYVDLEREGALVWFDRDDPKSIDDALSVVRQSRGAIGARAKASYQRTFTREAMVAAYVTQYGNAVRARASI